MGQILIISDSHYMPKNKLLKFINQFDSLKAVIHCGDIYIGYQPGDLSINCPLYMCKGNNDFADIPRILHFEMMASVLSLPMATCINMHTIPLL